MIEFVKEGHIYVKDGVILPSVSQILKKLFPNKYDDVPEEILNNKASWGTHIHEIIETMEINKIFKPEAFTEEFLKLESLKDYLKIKKENNIQVINQEQIVSFKYIYCGTYDMLATVKGNKSLIDIKTTAELDEEYLSWQLGLYAYALNDSEIKKYYCLWLPKGKRGRPVEIKIKTKKEIERFLKSL